jgi:3-hydroxyisobutyrate dehydrogenase-like beta-hydroxyacid dehydrogenase
MMTLGFVGLGNMGSALATNLAGAGHNVVTYPGTCSFISAR